MEKLDDARIVRSVPAPPGEDVTVSAVTRLLCAPAPGIIRAIDTREEQRRTRRLQRLVALTAALLIVALALGAVFGYLWHEASHCQKDRRVAPAGRRRTGEPRP